MCVSRLCQSSGPTVHTIRHCPQSLGSFTPVFYIIPLQSFTARCPFSVPPMRAIAFGNGWRSSPDGSFWDSGGRSRKRFGNNPRISITVSCSGLFVFRVKMTSKKRSSSPFLGFFRSDEVKLARDRARGMAENAIGNFMRHTLLSHSLPESVKLRRLTGHHLPPCCW